MSDIAVTERLWFAVWLVMGLQALFAAIVMGVTLEKTGVTERGWIRRRGARWGQVKSVELGWVGSLRAGLALYGPALHLQDGTQLRIRSLGAPINPKRLPGSRTAEETDIIWAYHDAARPATWPMT
jgi:hypothetical protein